MKYSLLELSREIRAWNGQVTELNKKVSLAQEAFTTAAVYGMLLKRISSSPNKDSLTIADPKNETTTAGPSTEIVLPEDMGLLIGSFLSRKDACSVVATCQTANFFARNARMQVLGNTAQDEKYAYQADPLLML